ncbi:Polymer-forming protein [Desulfonispora thiosulfatigenes DSM 11270]|uniref:Polymer-forming protein n=1 Tax=Desulfonispora thiosulfatigenes DSM 11270 TaxID=656914 RepID=A0A1W1V734_DESTI|nr:leucine-rich repeat protein [Desulfonispora thiosulfatigenes]SMB88990.1 Polymer-forming protein [Desulfonispora thiosulfatigenes DSM 11270]
MENMILLIMVFILLLTAPVWIAYIYFKKDSANAPYINKNRDRDPRYFGISFSRMIKEKWHTRDLEGYMMLSRLEKTISSEVLGSLEDVEDIVIAEEDEFHPVKKHRFLKEIYARGQVWLEGITELRAIYSDKDMMIGNNTHIFRWLDAEGTVAIFDSCQLGVSATSAIRISIGYDCSFRRLYAPEILLGQHAGKEALNNVAQRIKENNFCLEEIPDAIYRVKTSLWQYLEDEEILLGSVIATEDLQITEDTIIHGDVRGQKSIKILDRAIICGNVFAEGKIILGEFSCVLGNLFSQETIILEKGAVVGKRGRISSVVAREGIIFEGDNFVYGLVSCEHGGRTSPAKENQGEGVRQYSYLAKVEENKSLIFKNAESFVNHDPQGFRRQKEIEKVEIPEGVLFIPRSFFYECSGIRELKLPSTLAEIHDFAFKGCAQLKELSLIDLKRLRKIGTSAFEGCTRLERVILPGGFEEIGIAAFSGCTMLTEVIIEEPAASLYKIGSHAFMNCINLQNLELPAGEIEIGISAFRGCDQLDTVIKERGLEQAELINKKGLDQVELRKKKDLDQIELIKKEGGVLADGAE